MTDQEVWLRVLEAVLMSPRHIGIKGGNITYEELADDILREFRARFPKEESHFKESVAKDE